MANSENEMPVIAHCYILHQACRLSVLFKGANLEPKYKWQSYQDVL